jgi:hypothetical protein
MSSDTYDFLIDDLKDYCTAIEQLKDDIHRVYRLRLPMLLTDSEYAKVFTEQHQSSFEFDLSFLESKQRELRALYEKHKLRLSLNESGEFVQRIMDALEAE